MGLVQDSDNLRLGEQDGGSDRRSGPRPANSRVADQSNCSSQFLRICRLSRYARFTNLAAAVLLESCPCQFPGFWTGLAAVDKASPGVEAATTGALIVGSWVVGGKRHSVRCTPNHRFFKVSFVSVEADTWSRCEA